MDGYFLTKKLICIGRDDIDQSSYGVGDTVHFRRYKNYPNNYTAMDILKYSEDEHQNEIIIGHVHAIHSAKVAPLIDSYVSNSCLCVSGNVAYAWDGDSMVVNIDFFSRNNGMQKHNMIADVKHTLRSIDGFVMNTNFWES